jgi:hypothetical protein
MGFLPPQGFERGGWRRRQHRRRERESCGVYWPVEHGRVQDSSLDHEGAGFPGHEVIALRAGQFLDSLGHQLPRNILGTRMKRLVREDLPKRMVLYGDPYGNRVFPAPVDELYARNVSDGFRSFGLKR